MASTPSASALSAVLRCRGNIWARNPPTKRPANSAYSLGLAGGVVRDFPAERSRSNRASTWESFLRGGRAVVGRRLTVAYESPRVNVQVQRGKDSRQMNTICHPKLSQSSGAAHSAVPGVQNALVRHLALTLKPNQSGIDKCSIIQMIKYETNAAHVCKILLVQETSESPAGVLKVSLTSPRLMEVESAGQIPSFVLTGWSTLKSTCLSLTDLVSEFMCLKLGVLCRSSCSPDDASKHLLSQQEEKNTAHCRQMDKTTAPMTPPSTKNNTGSGQRITEDRPD